MTEALDLPDPTQVVSDWGSDPAAAGTQRQAAIDLVRDEQDWSVFHPELAAEIGRKP